MNQYELLSVIYKIVGETSVKTFEQILNSKKQPSNILAIIQALKGVRLEIEDKEKVSKVKNQIKKIQKNDEKNTWSSQAQRLWRSLQNTFSETKKHKILNKDIVNAFISAGLKTNARSKEGRQKILIMIQTSLDVVGDSKRINILNKVSDILGLSQTKGWMEVIKSNTLKNNT